MTRNVLVCELMFTDDISFMAHNHQNIQEIITCFLKSTMAFGLKETEVTYQPCPGFHDIGQDIQIEGQDLET